MALFSRVVRAAGPPPVSSSLTHVSFAFHIIHNSHLIRLRSSQLSLVSLSIPISIGNKTCLKSARDVNFLVLSLHSQFP